MAVKILITGLVVVFAVLLLLTGIIKLYGTLVFNAQNKKNNSKGGPKVENKAAPVSQPIKASEPFPVVEQGIPGEVIAVIAAAVAAMGDGVTSYSVKRVRRSAGTRPVWSTAGLMDNTRPF